MRTARFTRRASPRQVKTTGMVRMGGELLSPRDAAFLREYLKHFNGIRAGEAVGMKYNTAGATASVILKNPKVRQALVNSMEERRNRVDVTMDQVARYWHDIATADARELSQHVRVPCRYCWGEDHLYQFTDTELKMAARDHELGIIRARRSGQLEHTVAGRGAIVGTLTDEQRRNQRPFDILGGPGYTRNRDPMRGPDWISRMERTYTVLGRPIPEGLEANSDHSCPECHGDGDSYVWFADTRHLSIDGARLYAGIRVTRDGMEIKTRSQDVAMDKFEQLTGMIKPRRPKFDFNLEDLSAEELDSLIDEARSRGLLSDEEVARGRIIDVVPVSSEVEDKVE